MLKVISQCDVPDVEAYSMVMRCGNCRRLIRKGFVVPTGSPATQRQAIDEISLELWSAFACEACDYDRAFVLAIGFDPPSDRDG